MEPLAIDAQLARGLRAAQHQHGEDGDRLRRNLQHALDVVRVARYPPAARFHHQVGAFQAVERRLHFGLGRLHHRRATGLLVRARDERVERQRIAVGNGVLLLVQSAENAGFEKREISHSGGRRRCQSVSS